MAKGKKHSKKKGASHNKKRAIAGAQAPSELTAIANKPTVTQKYTLKDLGVFFKDLLKKHQEEFRAFAVLIHEKEYTPDNIPDELKSGRNLEHLRC